MRRFFGALLRFLALIAPQLVVSALVLAGFRHWLYLRSDFAWLHLPLVAVVQCAFHGSWGLIARSRFGNLAAVRRLFALSLWAKGLAINGVYLASAATNSFWGDNFAMENVASARAHIQGLQAAFGWVVPVSVAAAALALLGSAIAFLKFAPSLYRVLKWGTGSNAHDEHRSPASAFVTVSAVAAFAAVLGCWMQINLTNELRRDPLFSFWLNLGSANATYGTSLADTQARQAYPVAADFDRRNVFIFIVDSLRSDHLPLYGYSRDTTPFLRELQESGRLVAIKNPVPVGNSSPQGMFGILMSRYPEGQRPGAFMLHEVLQKQGYRTAAYLAGDKSTFAGVRRYFGNGFETFIDGVKFAKRSVNDDAGVLDALEALPPSDGRPVFLLFNLMSVHVVGLRDPGFSRWSPSRYDAQFANDAFVADPELARNTYDNRIVQADAYLRKIWSVLEAKGYLRNYTATITSDHGEELGERGNYGHGSCLFHEDTTIPLLFAGSSIPKIDARFASQIDIAPTLLSLLRLPVPPTWEGLNLLGDTSRTTAFLAARRANSWRGVIQRNADGAYKYLFFGPLNGQWNEALFDLRSDPEERHDLIRNPPPATLNALRQLAAEHFRVPIPPDVLRTGERTSPATNHDTAGE